jgi:hypothetical protein
MDAHPHPGECEMNRCAEVINDTPARMSVIDP